MAKALCGFILGVGLTALAFVMFDDAPEISTLDAGRAPSSPDSGTPESVVRQPSPDEGLEPVSAPLLGTAQRESRASARQEEPPVEEAPGDSEAPPNPILLPPEFAWLSERPSNNHAAIEYEPSDPNWAAATEAQLNTYFLERPDLTEKFGYPMITCRTTRCELAFVSYVLDESAVADAPPVIPAERAMALLFLGQRHDFHDQAWAAQFTRLQDDVEVNIQDGVTTILWHIGKIDDETRVVLSSEGRR